MLNCPTVTCCTFAGNYGGAWYRQKKDFAEFPGAILMTTNCIMDPSPTYADRLFTTGEVGVSASRHLAGTSGRKDFSAVIKRAQELPGFSHEPEPKFVTVGFGHEATLGAAGGLLACTSLHKPAEGMCLVNFGLVVFRFAMCLLCLVKEALLGFAVAEGGTCKEAFAPANAKRSKALSARQWKCSTDR